MTNNQVALIKRFLNDKEMQETIKAFLKDEFMRKKDNADTSFLAAQMLSLQFVNDAWSEMERYKANAKGEAQGGNPGV